MTIKPTRSSLPQPTDRITLSGTDLEVSPFCLGGISSEDTTCAAFDAGINFFFVTADMHWPLYEIARRGLRKLLARGRQIRDQIVVAAVSYCTQPEFCTGPYLELMNEIPSLGTIDVLIAGGAYTSEFMTRLETYQVHRRTSFAGNRAIGTTFHDRKGALLACNHNLVDIAFVRYNAAHSGARRDVFPFLQESSTTRLFSFKSLDHYIAPDRLCELGVDDEWIPEFTDYYKFALARPEIDGLLCSPTTPVQIEELCEALEGPPLTVEQEEYMIHLSDLSTGRSPSFSTSAWNGDITEPSSSR